MHNTGVYYWKFGCCFTLLLEIHLQTSSSIKWKHFDQSRRKTIKIFLPAIKIIKTGVYMTPIFSHFLLEEKKYMYLVVKFKVYFFCITTHKSMYYNMICIGDLY